MFQRPISNLIDRVREAEVGGVRAAFGEAVARIAQDPDLTPEQRQRIVEEIRKVGPGWDFADELLHEVLDVMARVDALEQGEVAGRGTMLPPSHPAHRPAPQQEDR